MSSKGKASGEEPSYRDSPGKERTHEQSTNEGPQYIVARGCEDLLPVDKPKGHPHLIKDSSLADFTGDATKLQLADGIASFLYQYNPKVLRMVLDPNDPNTSCVELDLQRKYNDSRHWKIERTKDIVSVRVACQILNRSHPLTQVYSFASTVKVPVSDIGLSLRAIGPSCRQTVEK